MAALSGSIRTRSLLIEFPAKENNLAEDTLLPDTAKHLNAEDEIIENLSL